MEKSEKMATSRTQLLPKHIVITLNIKRPEDKPENMLLFSTPLTFSLSLIKVFGKKLKFQALESHEAKARKKTHTHSNQHTHSYKRAL